MMDGWSWWGPGVFLMVFVMVACMMAMALMMVGHGHGAHDSPTGKAPGNRRGEAERILAERLARGDINIEEYERRLAALHEPARSTYGREVAP